MENKIFADVRQQNRTMLTEIEAKQVLKSIGIPATETRLATSPEEAIVLSRALGFPAVLKISSPDISHKSDAGGVRVDLKNEEEIVRAYQEIMTSVKHKCPKAKIEGIAVQNMARPGTEVIIGMTTDHQFGAVIMFGLGGIWVEVLKDVTFRLAPLTRFDAREMITGIKGYPLLKGFRNSEPAQMSILEDILLKLSDLAHKHPEIQEMDLNPVLAYRDGALVVDARIVLNEGK